MFLATCSPACVNGAVCISPNLCSCHACSTSSYGASCNSCSTSSNGCTITCSCANVNGVFQSTTVVLTPGYGNGCDLSNINGVLLCGGSCP